MGNPTKKAAIHQLAGILADVLPMSAIEIENAPQMIGGAIRYVDGPIEGEMDAMLEKAGTDSFVMTINHALTKPERRFTIAHGIGHLFMHMGYLINPVLWETTEDYKDSVYHRFGYSIEEMEANEFAGVLLMPEAAYRHVAKQHLHQGYYDIEPIAEHFNVPIHAAKNRGYGLGLFRLY